MNMKRIVPFILMCVLIDSCVNDDSFPAIHSDDYLPLEVGNYWEFQGSAAGDANKFTIRREVVGTENLEGENYFVVVTGNENYWDTTYYRKDNQRYVFMTRRAGNEYNIFRLDAGDKTQWVASSADWNYHIDVKVESVQIGDRDFTNVKIYSYDDPHMADEEHFISLAPGIGFVKEGSYAWGITYQLSGARIHGVIYHFD
jgi:hypothetical protein